MKLSRNRFEMKRDTIEAVSRRVMNVTRQSSAFGQHGRKLGLNLSQTQPVESPTDESDENRTERIKPVCLIEMWFKIKLKRSATWIPYKIIIRCDHPERVMSWRNVGIRGVPFCPCIYPVGVESLELVFELHFLRRDIAKSGKVEFESVFACRERILLSRRNKYVVNKNLLDNHGCQV